MVNRPAAGALVHLAGRAITTVIVAAPHPVTIIAVTVVSALLTAPTATTTATTATIAVHHHPLAA